MNTAAATFSEYRTLPLTLINKSTTNHRRTFEPTKLVELAQSISVSGLIQPLTVRPKADRFEIIAGARRYRAAQIAELTEVPTRILELTYELPAQPLPQDRTRRVSGACHRSDW